MNTRFTLTETARIIVPGLYFSLLLGFTVWSVAPEGFGAGRPPGSGLATLVFTTLIAGLTMYARELPKRRRAFIENQPSVHLQGIARTLKGAEALSDDEARRLYFYILNTHVPPLIHEKVFFFGAVYHIIIHIRRTTFWFALLATALLLYRFAVGGTWSDNPALVTLTIAVWCIYALNVRYNKADRKMQENYLDQILWLDMNRPLVERLIKERHHGLKRGGE